MWVGGGGGEISRSCRLLPKKKNRLKRKGKNQRCALDDSERKGMKRPKTQATREREKIRATSYSTWKTLSEKKEGKKLAASSVPEEQREIRALHWNRKKEKTGKLAFHLWNSPVIDRNRQVKKRGGGGRKKRPLGGNKGKFTGKKKVEYSHTRKGRGDFNSGLLRGKGQRRGMTNRNSGRKTA